MLVERILHEWGIDTASYYPYGRYLAKVRFERDHLQPQGSRLILMSDIASCAVRTHNMALALTQALQSQRYSSVAVMPQHTTMPAFTHPQEAEFWLDTELDITLLDKVRGASLTPSAMPTDSLWQLISLISQPCSSSMLDVTLQELETKPQTTTPLLLALMRRAALVNVVSTPSSQHYIMHGYSVAGGASVRAMSLASYVATWPVCVVNNLAVGLQHGLIAMGFQVGVVVLTATVLALKQLVSGASIDSALISGLTVLANTVALVKRFGLPCVVVLDTSVSDTMAELQLVRSYCGSWQVAMHQLEWDSPFSHQSLAALVAEIAWQPLVYQLPYANHWLITQCIEAMVAYQYGISQLVYMDSVSQQLNQWQQQHWHVTSIQCVPTSVLVSLNVRFASNMQQACVIKVRRLAAVGILHVYLDLVT